MNDLPNRAKGTYLGQSKSSLGLITFTNASDKMLFDLLPLINDVDPTIVDDILQKHPAFRGWKGSDVSSQVSQETVSVGGGNAESQNSLQTRISSQEQLSAIYNQATSNPQSAIASAMSISDPSSELDALEYLSSRPQLQANSSIAGGAAKLLADTKDPLQKLRVHVVLAEQARKRNDLPSFQQELLTGFDIGDLLVDEYLQTYPTSSIEGAEAFPSLSRLVALGMRSDVSEVDLLQQIRLVPNGVLKAYLLIDAAEAAHVGNHSPSE